MLTFFGGFIAGWGCCGIYFTLIAIFRPDWLRAKPRD